MLITKNNFIFLSLLSLSFFNINLLVKADNNIADNNIKENTSNKCCKCSVLAIDLHGTCLEGDKWQAAGHARKAGPKFVLKAIRMGLKKKIFRKKNKKDIHAEHYLMSKRRGGSFNDHVLKAISSFKPIPGIEKWLQKIKDQNYKIIAFSNIGPQSLEYLSQKFPNLFKLFDHYIIADNEDSALKSNPRAYKDCIKNIEKYLNYTPKKIIFFDDSKDNLRLARNTSEIFKAIHCNKDNLKASRALVTNALEKYSK